MTVPPERSDEERLTKIRRDEARWRPGTLAYAALAVLVAFALILAAVTATRSRDKAFKTAAANCRVTEALSGAFVDLLNQQTAPRILGKGATAAQVAAQTEANAEARVYRESQLAKLRALSCSRLAGGTPVAVPVAEPSPPSTVVGPAGDRGSAGLTGGIGLTGAAGPQGTAGAVGANGTAGDDGPDGPVGPPGADGAPGAPGADGADGAPGAEGPPGPAGPLPPTFTFEVDGQTVTCVLVVDAYTCTATPTPP